MPLQVGDRAPDFTLPDQQGHPVSLADLRGRRVVIYFYPKDDTPGCTKEACGFRDDFSLFEQAGIVVLGVSKDPASKHQKFIAKYELPFTLLTDADAAVASAYDSYGLKKFMGREYMGMMRHTFVIDAEGNIEQIYTKVKPETHARQILTDLGVAIAE
ncbi:thioredoxin-dependent thiol peroxidase [Synechococcus elongatus]|uniref:thioredoxin-dependent peroxiredoxin n=1 Tax=Synechococcus elongatus PCC 11802 TaxID=2283154 RepID=A0AAT9JV69_SYNEL|nr:thioredoxin-dependent thiol peroxidase [Synechococcus elongatus]QFZ92849.1 thioredoxin-dependent thiol peroxidase [Synechococcus elongatus PCC 11802]